ncbi:MAG: hypothetical protein H9864_06685 [Candidatus Faecalibacterium intestinavium]|uniref:Uncharacterized protein n=1 Tax=Candidatus Faecalibacterium intestinavium TaxID=2838580 RepID=A0A9E2KLQ2_9FIRM|nr:hypothetical protein [Candidatus Faecalibacterium intestinavium]
MKINRSDGSHNVSDNQKVAHINGRYGIIKTLITVVGTMFATSGGIFYFVNNSNYITPKGQETISQQEADLQSLQSTYADLQDQYTALEESAQNLQIAYEEALAKLESLSQTEGQTAASVAQTPEQTNGGTTKLTSLPVIGNNNDYYNHVYNNPENSGSARSNLGDVFNSCISMRDDGNIDFFLNSEYQSLTFTLCISEGTRDIDNHYSSISIYSVDGNGENESLTQLYSSPSVTMGFIPTQIPPIDVSGVTHLRISFYGDNNPYGPRIILGDPQLQ